MSLSDGILKKADQQASEAEAKAEERHKDLAFHSGATLEARAQLATIAIAAEMRALRLRSRFEREYAASRQRRGLA